MQPQSWQSTLPAALQNLSARANATSVSIITLPEFETEWVLSEGRIWLVSLIKYGPVRMLLH